MRKCASLHGELLCEIACPLFVLMFCHSFCLRRALRCPAHYLCQAVTTAASARTILTSANIV